MSNAKPIVYDAESEAYFQRYPELRPVLALYGKDGARLHYQNYGQKEGRTWGAQTPAPVAPAAPVETVSTQPLPDSYGTDADSWASWLTGARQATEGMNQMPYVFSDYGSVPVDDKAASAMFYPADQQDFRSVIANAATVPAATSSASSPSLSDFGPFTRMMLEESSPMGVVSQEQINAFMAQRGR